MKNRFLRLISLLVVMAFVFNVVATGTAQANTAPNNVGSNIEVTTGNADPAQGSSPLPGGEVSPQWVETVFDVGNFMISLSEYYANPSFWGAFRVVFDGAAVAFPGIPSVSSLRNGAAAAKAFIESSPKLKKAFEYGIDTYNKLKNTVIPFFHERHHIFEKRFAARLSTTEGNMFSIVLEQVSVVNQNRTSALIENWTTLS